MEMNSGWPELVAIISVGFAVSVLAAVLLIQLKELLRPEASAGAGDQPGLLAACKPLVTQLTLVLHRIPVLSKIIENGAAKWHPLLVKAGEPGGINGQEFEVIRLIGLVGVPLLVGFASGGKSPVLVMVGAIFGYLAPVYLLRARVTRRAELVVAELPDALDLISLMTAAGLDLGQAMEYYARGARRTPLVELFQAADKHMKLGRTRSESLQYMARSADVIALTQVVSGLVQAERLGAPIAPFLNEQSADQRDARFARAEESGQKAPVKLLAPLLFFVVPGVFIVVFGPMVLQYMSGQR